MSSIEVLKKDIQVVLKDVEDILGATKDDVSEKAVAMRKKLEDAKHHLLDARDRAVKVGVETGKKINQKVEDKPWHAVGIAAAAGLVVGILIGRK